MTLSTATLNVNARKMFALNMAKLKMMALRRVPQKLVTLSLIDTRNDDMALKVIPLETVTPNMVLSTMVTQKMMPLSIGHCVN